MAPFQKVFSLFQALCRAYSSREGSGALPASKKLKNSRGGIAIAPSVTLEGIALKMLPVSAKSRKMDIPIREPAENPSIFTCVNLWASLLLPINCCLISGTMGLSSEKKRLSSTIVSW